MKDEKSNRDLVTELIEQLDPENRAIVSFIRDFVLEISSEISEQIKWNSPCFYFNGDMRAFDPKEYKRDLLVINIHRGSVLLVFPTGSVIKHKDISDAVNYPDGRKIIKIHNLEDAKIKQNTLQEIISNWLEQVEK